MSTGDTTVPPPAPEHEPEWPGQKVENHLRPSMHQSRLAQRLNAAQSAEAIGAGDAAHAVDPAAAQRNLRATSGGTSMPGDKDAFSGAELGSDLARIVEKYQYVDSAVYSFYRVAPSHAPGLGNVDITGYQGRVASRQFRCAEDLLEFVEQEYGGNVWDIITQVQNAQGKLVYARDGRTRFTIDALPIPKQTKKNAAQFAAAAQAAGDPGLMVDRAFKIYEKAAGFEGKNGAGEDSQMLGMLERQNTALKDEIKELRASVTKAQTEGGPTTSLLQTLLPSNNQAVLQAQQQGATALAEQATRYQTAMADADKRWSERVKDLEKDLRELVNEHREDLAEQRKELVKDKENEVGRIDSELKSVRLAFDTFKSSVDMTINSRVASAEAPLRAEIVAEKARTAHLERRLEDSEKECNKLRDERYKEALTKGDAITQMTKAAELAGLMGLKRSDDADGQPPDRLTALLDVAEKTGAIDKVVTRLTGGAPAAQGGQVFRLPIDGAGRPIVNGQPMPSSVMPPIVQPTPPVQQHHHQPAPQSPQHPPAPAVTPAAAEGSPAALAVPQMSAEELREKMREAADFLAQSMTNGVPASEVVTILRMRVPAEGLAAIVQGGVEQFQQQIEEVADGSPLLSGRGTSWLNNLLLAIQTTK